MSFCRYPAGLMDRFMPDRERHRTLRALVAFAAVQSTYKGPFTPGSALCLVYTFAQNEGGGAGASPLAGGRGSHPSLACWTTPSDRRSASSRARTRGSRFEPARGRRRHDRPQASVSIARPVRLRM
jgi:hypothetical protein